MFGYVKTDKPEMKIKEYEAYRGLYCSLCKAMGKHFGVFSRLTLSYDITFLVLARLSFTGTLPCFDSGRCTFNQTKKCSYCNNAQEELRYASAIAMMMFYHKVRDNISDGSVLKKLLMYLCIQTLVRTKQNIAWQKQYVVHHPNLAFFFIVPQKLQKGNSNGGFFYFKM